MRHLGGALALAALLGLVVGVATPAVAAERSVVVTVVNGGGEPLAGVSVVVAADKEFAATTDERGEVRFSTSTSEVEVTATANGRSTSLTSSESAIRLELKERS